MNRIVRITIFAFICLLAGSAYAQEPKPAPQAPSTKIGGWGDTATKPSEAKPADDGTKAIIYFYRIKQFMNAALEPSVIVDGKSVARMDNGRYFGVALEPGKHAFQMGDKQTGFEIDAKAGQVYYARVSIEMGVLKGHGRLTLIQPEQGAFEIKKVKLLGADKVTERSMVTVYEGNDKMTLEKITEVKTAN